MEKVDPIKNREFLLQYWTDEEITDNEEAIRIAQESILEEYESSSVIPLEDDIIPFTYQSLLYVSGIDIFSFHTNMNGHSDGLFKVLVEEKIFDESIMNGLIIHNIDKDELDDGIYILYGIGGVLRNEIGNVEITHGMRISSTIAHKVTYKKEIDSVLGMPLSKAVYYLPHSFKIQEAVKELK